MSIKEQHQCAFYLEKDDFAKLKEEADNLGFGNVSVLLRFLVRRFLSNPSVNVNSEKRDNS